MIVNDPATLAEVTEVFERYEAAFIANDIEGMDALFWQDDRVVRHGIADYQHGAAEVTAFRHTQPSRGLERELDRVTITTFGTAFATASILFRRDSTPGKVGRQMQTWARLPQGWRVVAAHVSIIDEPITESPTAE